MTAPAPMATMASLGEERVVAILRGGDSATGVRVGRVLVDNGVRWLEVTTNSSGWQDTVASLASTGATVGAGTVLTADHVRGAARAGARFVVAPDTSVEVGQAALELGLAWLPGALTPTEVLAAHRTGATAVKIFPASAVGGAEYVRALRGPLQDIPLVPTGGVRLEDVPGYLAAGAVAVGLGSPLIGDALRGGSLDELARRAQAVRVATRELA